MIRTNRSKIVSFLHCPRYRYNKYHALGKGLQRVTRGLPGVSGNAFHSALKDIALGVSVDDAIATQIEDFSAKLKAQSENHPFYQTLLAEQTYLIDAGVRAIVRVRLPEIERDFELLEAEVERQWEVEPGLVIDLRFDRVERERATGSVIIRDWKMTSTGGYEWARKFERDPQVFCYVAGAKALFPHYDVSGIAFEGLARGRKRASKIFPGFKEQQTPLCYAYQHETGAWSARYQPGGAWSKQPLWEHMPAKEWVEEKLTPSDLRDLFISSVPPINPPEMRLREWTLQTVPQEKRLAASVTKGLDMTPAGRVIWLAATFPKNSDACYKFGQDYPCEFDDLCWNEQVEEDPFGSGLYEERESHHPDDEE